MVLAKLVRQNQKVSFELVIMLYKNLQLVLLHVVLSLL